MTTTCRCGCGRGPARRSSGLAGSCHRWWMRNGQPGTVPPMGARGAAPQFPPSLNQARALEAATRNVAMAEALLARPAGEFQHLDIARMRVAHPSWTWAQIAAPLELTKDQAAAAFRRMTLQAGLR